MLGLFVDDDRCPKHWLRARTRPAVNQLCGPSVCKPFLQSQRVAATTQLCSQQVGRAACGVRCIVSMYSPPGRSDFGSTAMIKCTVVSPCVSLHSLNLVFFPPLFLSPAIALCDHALLHPPLPSARCLNESTPGGVLNCLKSWNKRRDPQPRLESEEDDPELIIFVPFTQVNEGDWSLVNGQGS